MQKFIKKSHIPFRSIIWMLAAMTCLIIAAFGQISDGYELYANLINILIIAFAFFLIRYMSTFGLYIGDSIYFKLFKYEKINLDEIAAIKITPAIMPNGTGSFQVIKGKDKQPLYSMIFIRSIDDGMDSLDSGDFYFHYNYKNSIMFYVTYDQSVIDYLLTRNPNIIVF